MRTLLVLVFLAIVAVATPSVSRAEPTLDEIRQGAAYAQGLNVLISGFSQVYEETVAYDALAEAVIGGQVSPDDAGRNVQELSLRLRARHAELAAQLAANPQPPTVADDQVRRTLANTLQMAESTQAVTLEAIESGERLVEAARRGDPDFYLQRTVKHLELTRGQIANQAMLYQNQIDIESGPNVSYYLYSAMKAQADILVQILGMQIEMVQGRALAPDAFAAPRDLIAQGRSHVQSGQASYDQMLQVVNATPAQGPADEANKNLVLDALSNIPASFAVEANLLTLIEGYIGQVESGTFDEAGLASFQQQASALENQRMQLQIERQQKLQLLPSG